MAKPEIKDFDEFKTAVISAEFKPVTELKGQLDPKFYPEGAVAAKMPRIFDINTITKTIQNYGVSGEVNTKREEQPNGTEQWIVLPDGDAAAKLKANLRSNTPVIEIGSGDCMAAPAL